MALASVVIIVGISVSDAFQTPASNPFASRAEVVRILRDEQFKVIHRVEKLPYTELIAAGVISARHDLKSFIVDPGEEFENSDSLVDLSKPRRQLIIAATSAQHEVICFWMPTQGGPAPYFMVIRRAGSKSNVAFYALLNNDVPKDVWNWANVKRLVFQNKIDTLISAEHPRAYQP